LYIFLTFICGFAQTDSLTIKLKKIKTLKDSSLISQDEFEQLKLKALGLEPKIKKTPISQDDVAKLKRKLKGQTIGASVTGLACMGVGYGAYLKSQTVINIEKDSKGGLDYEKYTNDVRIKRNDVIALGIVSGIFGAFSIGNMITSQITSAKLRKAKRGLSLNFNSNGASVAYSF